MERRRSQRSKHHVIEWTIEEPRAHFSALRRGQERSLTDREHCYAAGILGASDTRQLDIPPRWSSR